MKKNILITGITGQDGIFLVNELLTYEENIAVVGFSRQKNNQSFFNKLNYLNPKLNLDNLQIININQSHQIEVDDFISSYKPNFVYNFTGPSSVYESIENPLTTSKEMIQNFIILINALLKNNNHVSFFQPSSSEMFDNNIEEPLTEKSYLNPRSSYALSKFHIFKLCEILRKKYDWNINSGILFNHESEFRNNNYLIMKIIDKAIRIKNGEKSKLEIGSLTLVRDWSFAGDIVHGIKLISQGDFNTDFVIGSGKGNTIGDLVNIVFDDFKLNVEDNVVINKNLLRKGDPHSIISDPSKINKKTGWAAETSFENLILRCINYKLKNLEA